MKFLRTKLRPFATASFSISIKYSSSAAAFSTIPSNPHSERPSTGRMSNRNACELQRNWGIIEPVSFSPSLFRLFLEDDGVFPNNPQHPVVIASSAFEGTTEEGEHLITKDGQWTSPWIWGIFPYHHYHSTAWELLLCIQGQASIQLGGPKGPTTTVRKGDLLLIPPGVAHKQLDTKGGFSLLGSYPTSGCSGSVDTLRGEPTEKQRRNILDCVTPTSEPILGLDLSKFY